MPIIISRKFGPQSKGLHLAIRWPIIVSPKNEIYIYNMESSVIKLTMIGYLTLERKTKIICLLLLLPSGVSLCMTSHDDCVVIGWHFRHALFGRTKWQVFCNLFFGLFCPQRNCCQQRLRRTSTKISRNIRGQQVVFGATEIRIWLLCKYVHAQ